MRKNFIDNIRWIIILLLFPFHTLFIYNALGIDYCILYMPSMPITVFLTFFSMWLMPLLFLLAGCSARYSLERRTLCQYMRERFTKLLLPLASGIMLVLPVTAYIGECYNHGFFEGIIGWYMIFFGGIGSVAFDGSFSLYKLNHLWFILYLFIISVITFPLLALFVRKSYGFNLDKVQPRAIAVFGGAAYIAMDIFLPGAIDKNIIDMTFLFLLGYCCFSNDGMQLWLLKMRWSFLSVSVAVFAAGWILMWGVSFMSAIYSWFAMMAAIGWGVRLLDTTNRVCQYFKTASYGIYFFHMPWVIAVSYWLLTSGASPFVHIVVTMPTSFVATIATYELVRRITPLRFAFALSKP